MRFGVLDLVGDQRKRRRPVNQNLETVPFLRPGITGGKTARRRVKCTKSADSRQSATMMPNNDPLDRLTHSVVQLREGLLHSVLEDSRRTQSPLLSAGAPWLSLLDLLRRSGREHKPRMSTTSVSTEVCPIGVM